MFQRATFSFVESAFGSTRDGRTLFMPFGVYGRAYIVADPEQAIQLRRDLRAFGFLAFSFVALLLSTILVRNYAGANTLFWLLISAAVTGSAFFFGFTLWAKRAGSRLAILEAGTEAIPTLFDLEADAANAIAQVLLPKVEEESDWTNALSLAGCLAGFSCQVGVRMRAEAEHRASGLVEIATTRDRLYYFGDALNGPLAEGSPSIWSIVSSNAPVTPLLPVFKTVTSEIGSDTFEYYADGLVKALHQSWRSTSAFLDARGIEPDRWPFVIAAAAKKIAEECPLDLTAASIIVMTAAIPSSKLDPAEVIVPER
ncbi:hypothetical protein HJG53_10360 [Sphingomonas sp. ID1715]|uniref:hypothetical protein n=1 Tax=Sphingomonas sp. ID1715 TaxID=1656898 RepID=UPI001488B3B6|nr:hypothetical protein [Sphingomonas sp. ID1715]NNM77307.1 hypothetical protein [Sphingomonas sp. ID1715]